MGDKVTNESSDNSTKFDKKYWTGVWKTIPMKIVILCMSGGAICVFPFLILQMQLLGINMKQIATLYLIIPFASVSGPIVSGLIADKTGKFRAVFVGNLILMAVCLNMLLIVPPVEEVEVSVVCNPDSSLTLRYDSCRDCVMKLGTNQGSLVLKDCRGCHDNETSSGSRVSEAFLCSDEQHPSSYRCPAFNSNQSVHLEVTNAFMASSETCDLYIYEITSNVSYYDTYTVCNATTNCNYKCKIDNDLGECDVANTFSKTYIMFGCFLFLANFFTAAAFTMMDASILAYCKENDLDLGKQRIMSVVGFGLAPLLAGFVTDWYKDETGSSSYFPAFMMSDFLFIITIIAMTMVKLKADLNESNIFKDLGKLLTRIEVDAFLLIVLILGLNFGFIETYIFVYLKSLGAPDFLLGLTLTVGCLSSIPMLFYADWLEMKIGRQNVFLLCFTAYSARMIGYSFIVNPWMCLIFEMLEAFTYQLLWVTCLKICPLVAPKGLLATMTGLAGSVHYSVGKGIGGFMGGYMIDSLGIKNAFRVFGGIALAGGIIYLIIHHTILKQKLAQRERELNEEKEEEELSKERENLMEEENEKNNVADKEKVFHRSMISLASTGKIILMGDEYDGEVRGARKRRSMPHIFLTEGYANIVNGSKSTTNLSP